MFPLIIFFSPPGRAVAVTESLQIQLCCVNVSALILCNPNVLIADLQQVLLEALCAATAAISTYFTLD